MERPKSESLLSPYMIAALTAGAILVAVLAVDRLEQQRYDKVREARILRSLSNARAHLEVALNERLFLTRGLRAYVSTHPNISVPEFNHLASVLLSQQGTSGIRSIQLAKDTVVSHVYPVQGNKEAIGLDLLNVPDQSAAVQRALDSKATVVAGPVKLVQGGTAFIGRTPIYLTPPGGPPNSGAYWGLATILIDDATIFTQSGIAKNFDDLQYALRGKDGMGARGEVFFGDPGIFGSKPSVLDIPDSRRYMAVGGHSFTRRSVGLAEPVVAANRRRITRHHRWGVGLFRDTLQSPASPREVARDFQAGRSEI